MASRSNVHQNLNSVEELRSTRRAGNRLPAPFSFTTKVLIAVASVFIVGCFVAIVLVPIFVVQAQSPSQNNEMTTTNTTTANISAVANITTVSVMTTVTTTATTTMMTTTNSIEFSYRGIYIDAFDSILGNTSSENSLLSWCVKYNFNAISVYDLNVILSSANNWAILAQFIKKARVTYGIHDVAAVRGSSSNFIENANYDSSRTDPNERFTVYNLENEWWNNGPACDFTCFTSIMQTMDGAAKNVTPPMIRETYIGWFLNPNGQELAMATTLENLLDRIMIHDYQTTPQFGYLQGRMSYLGEAAYNQNKTVNLIVIFSAEYNFMNNYFNVTGPNNNTFQDAYVGILNEFHATNFTFKGNIQLIGFGQRRDATYKTRTNSNRLNGDGYWNH